MSNVTSTSGQVAAVALSPDPERVPSVRDPSDFPLQLADADLESFRRGRHWRSYRMLGAHLTEVGGVPGVLFAAWAPHAERVSVVGDFNRWDGRRHPMRGHTDSGVWELFVPGLAAGALYKLEIRNRSSGAVLLKSDPYAQRFERRPATACLVAGPSRHPWQDFAWLAARAETDWAHAPLSIYEVHLGSWRRAPDGGYLNYRELAQQLVEHVASLGFTHVELLPVAEHQRDESLGYQTSGYFAPTSRFGAPDDLRFFVDYCHRHSIGVLLDWTPGHFPSDSHGIACFDGATLYELAMPGESVGAATPTFDYGRAEVKDFLYSSACYWLEEFHVDGLRVAGVACILYLDYSRQPDEWVPNKYGGNENLAGIDFLRELTALVQSQYPGVLMIAEESTAWPQVTRPPWVGGLGFSMKWNIGWTHDALEYMTKDPIHRHYHHQALLTFGLLYAFTEDFVLAISHEQVLPGNRSLLDRMPGDEWQRFANLRLLYTYMWTYPGKKLLFMGGEFAQGRQWNATAALDWHLLGYSGHDGVQALLRDLNRLYRDCVALHGRDFDYEGFEWIDCHDAPQSVISYLRRAGNRVQVVVLNFTPVPRHNYRIGVPLPGDFHETLNSDSSYYGGSNVGNGGDLRAEEGPWMGRPYSLSVTLPPLGGIVLTPQGD